jgi:hypothetical protein
MTGVQNPVGGTVAYDGTNVSFTSTGLTGQPASFEYVAHDAVNNTGIGQVLMNVTPLPPIDAYLYDTSVETQNHQSSITPPSASTVFNSWARFSNDTYFPGGTTPTGDAAAWQYNATLERVECTLNTNTCVGFVSPEQLDNFKFETTLSSTDPDNDFIGVLLAFKREGSVNNRLMAVRTCGGADTWGTGYPRWGLVLNLGGTMGAGTTGTVIVNGNHTNLNPPTSGWSTSGSSRIRILRQGNLFKLHCSPFGSTTYDPVSEINIDVSAIPSLNWAIGPQSYGYMAMSQNSSTFTNITLEGALDQSRVYDLQTGKVYEYVSGTGWVEISGTTIADELGYPRTVTNPETGNVYQIQLDKSIVKIS